jgi:RNA polymerase sigma factor (sigma-70 family)
MPKTTKRLHTLLAHLYSASAAVSDDKLLARFVADRDEDAFAHIVRRHGPMVMGVCQRLLHHTQDAEDVFQATFLVLARKAPSVANGDALGAWLYRVAFRTAQEARAMRMRRQAREEHLAETLHPVAAGPEVQDWRPVLDQELSRLPEKYQAAIVLCDLEDGTRKEVARQLGIAEGTLSSRLAHGRKLLAARLTRRGVSLGAGVMVATITQGVVSAHVPGSIVSKTAKAAALVAVGRWAMIPASVAVLTKGALKAMFMAKLKVVGGALVLTVLAIGVLGGVYSPVVAQNPPSAGKPATELDTLRKENELLKLNLQIVLEKNLSLQAELHAVKAELHAVEAVPKRPIGAYVPAPKSPQDNVPKTPTASYVPAPISEAPKSPMGSYYPAQNPDAPKSPMGSYFSAQKPPLGDPNATMPSIHDALKRLRDATDDKTRRETIDALEQAVQRLREELGRKKDSPE